MVVECHNCEVNIEAVEIANHSVWKGDDLTTNSSILCLNAQSVTHLY